MPTDNPSQKMPSPDTPGQPPPAPSTQFSPAPSPATPKPGAPTIYLIPCWLDEHVTAPLPAYILDAVRQCQVFFVENERSARRYLKAIWKEMVIDDYEWHTIHKAEDQVMTVFRQRLKEGKTIGLISEAGCPGVADPGQLLTAAA